MVVEWLFYCSEWRTCLCPTLQHVVKRLSNSVQWHVHLPGFFLSWKDGWSLWKPVMNVRTSSYPDIYLQSGVSVYMYALHMRLSSPECSLIFHWMPTNQLASAMKMMMIWMLSVVDLAFFHQIHSIGQLINNVNNQHPGMSVYALCTGKSFVNTGWANSLLCHLSNTESL